MNSSAGPFVFGPSNSKGILFVFAWTDQCKYSVRCEQGYPPLILNFVEDVSICLSDIEKSKDDIEFTPMKDSPIKYKTMYSAVCRKSPVMVN